jgi:hypothetical protein
MVGACGGATQENDACNKTVQQDHLDTNCPSFFAECQYAILTILIMFQVSREIIIALYLTHPGC